MSRYEFLPDGWSATYSLAIGWDEALGTFLAGMIDGAIGLDDNSVILWLGGTPPHYSDLDEMMRTFNARIAGQLHAVALTQEMRSMLLRDESAVRR